jgi:hypothetical protein
MTKNWLSHKRNSVQMDLMKVTYLEILTYPHVAYEEGFTMLSGVLTQA